jgi:predicted RNA binding protein YcfA (HicA-like mRNA interferase family)
MIDSREVMRRLKEAGWVELSRVNGSHHYFKHPDHPERGKVTVIHPARDYARGTLKSMERQTGVKLT